MKAFPSKHMPTVTRATVRIMDVLAQHPDSGMVEKLAGIIEEETSLPYLLAALRDCEARLCDLVSSLSAGTGAEYDREVATMRIARGAIAKAEGRP